MLETDRLRLRPFVTADLDDFFRAVGDAEVMRFIGNGRALTREETARALDRYCQRWEAEGIGHFALERKSDGRVLGRAGVVFWDPRTWEPKPLAELAAEAAVEIGWTLARDVWGHGYATEAALAARAHVRAALAPARLISLIHPENVRSQAVARRLGAVLHDEIETSGWGLAAIWVHPQHDRVRLTQ